MSSLGIVLSGGGARGAYEVGVLSYLYSDFAHRHGRAPHFDIINGTSVGAVNGTALASVAHEPGPGIELLRNVWLRQHFSELLRFGLQQARSVYRIWSGGEAPLGLFDPKPLARLISHEIPWRQLARNIRSGRVKGLTVSATNVRTGRATLYIDRAPGVALPRLRSRIDLRTSHILPHHVLASAAMPIVFPPVRIGSDYFCDGGIRLNTPTAPAVHLGVERLFVVGVSTPAGPADESHLPPGRVPGAAFLLGKALNALMLDHLDYDLEELMLINQILADGNAAFGPDFLPKINAQAAEYGRAARRMIRVLPLRPSVDIGRLAAEYLHSQRDRFLFGHAALRALDVGEGRAADLASYVLFDSDFARILIDLGRQDAAAIDDQLADFLLGA